MLIAKWKLTRLLTKGLKTSVHPWVNIIFTPTDLTYFDMLSCHYHNAWHDMMDVDVNPQQYEHMARIKFVWSPKFVLPNILAMVSKNHMAHLLS